MIKMRILGINGSPVKGGNVDLIIRKVIQGAKSRMQDSRGEIQDDIIYLDDFEIKPCKSCEVLPESDICTYHDGMDRIYPLILKSDLFVLGSPVYFDSVSAQMKLFIDRCNCLRPLRKNREGHYFDKSRIEKGRVKRIGAIVLVGGRRQRFNCALTVLKGFFNWVGIDFFEEILYSHNDFEIGKVGENKEALKNAFILGKKLVEGSI